MNSHPRLALLALWLLLPVVQGARALDSDSEQPMYIEADRVEVREEENMSLYAGHVLITQGSLRLSADEVTVYHREDRRPRQIIALGTPARLTQQLDDSEDELQAFALRMEYDVERDHLTLIEQAELIQGDDRVSGERILYDRSRAQFRAGGGGRVRITLTPEGRDTNTTAAP